MDLSREPKYLHPALVLKWLSAPGVEKIMEEYSLGRKREKGLSFDQFLIWALGRLRAHKANGLVYRLRWKR